MFRSIRSQFPRMGGYRQSSSVWKDKTRIPIIGTNKVRIPMFGRIRSEFQYLER